MNNNYKVSALSREKISNYAKKIRETYCIKGFYFPIIEFIELALPRLYNNFILIIEEPNKMNNYYGLTIPSENSIRIREDVYYRALREIGRDRFTIAHELGHYLLHRSVQFARTSKEYVNIKPYESSEWQANCFASEILIPTYNNAVGKLSIQDISSKCAVSYKAAEIAYNRININKAY